MSSGNKDIFIHIPKTGGTTINAAINKTDWQTQLDFNYRHIERESKISTSGDIFEPENFERYKEYNIFMMLRDPIDRLISEYHFLKERKNYIQLLTPEPKSFDDFIANPQAANYVVNFLVGRRLYDTTFATEEDLQKVLKAVDSLPIYVGIFEYFAESLEYFKDHTNIDLSNEIEAKRITLARPAKDKITEEQRQKILEMNKLDYILYDHCLEKFEKIKGKYKNTSINFLKSKYNHVIPYSQSFIFYRFCIENINYIKTNHNFFIDLNKHLLLNLKINTGEEFAATWNATFEEAVNRTFPGSDFSKAVYQAYKKDTDQLETALNIGRTIDAFFKDNGKSADKYYKKMEFSSAFVKRIKPEIIQQKSQQKLSFLQKLFKGKS